jgi:hypothetical protein
MCQTETRLISRLCSFLKGKNRMLIKPPRYLRVLNGRTAVNLEKNI